MTLITGSTGDDYLTGTADHDLIYGFGGNDELDGGAGNDTMFGGSGDDIFHVDMVYRDWIKELPGEGVDLVYATHNYSLKHSAPGVENLTLIGLAAINGVGNDLDNVITGNDRSNRLYGMGGSNTLIGGKGGDRYFVMSSGDHVIESVGEGVDTVHSWAPDFTLGENIERLQLMGSDNINATGSQGVDHIRGNAGHNRIAGGAGEDVLLGLGGNDDLLGDEGNDVLFGGFGADRLMGGEGHDALRGESGDDWLAGGTGDDRYVNVEAGDTVVELAGEGRDIVITGFDHVLEDNVEWLFMQGVAANGTGNTEDNLIRGNDRSNHLMGMSGNDRLRGRDGDDVLYGDEGRDVLDGGEGGDNLYGGEGNDVIFGRAGQDTLVGGAGVDTLRGGEGDDLYLLQRGDGGDLIIDESGSDVLQFSDAAGAVSRDQLWFRHTGDDLEIRIIGTENRTIIRGWYKDETNRLEYIKTAAGDTMLGGSVEILIDFMSQMDTPQLGQTTLTTQQHAALDGRIAVAWF
jgi:Ca2+-binding RTX toxin-like protein